MDRLGKHIRSAIINIIDESYDYIERHPEERDDIYGALCEVMLILHKKIALIHVDGEEDELRHLLEDDLLVDRLIGDEMYKDPVDREYYEKQGDMNYEED